MFFTTLRKIELVMVLMFIFGSVVFYFKLDEYHFSKAVNKARENLLYTDAMQIYVDAHMKPFVYDLQNQKRVSGDFFDPAVLSSTFMVSTINEMYKRRAQEQNITIDPVEFKFASNNPTNLANKADFLESKILKGFEKRDSDTLHQERIDRNGKDTLLLASPVRRNTQNCLHCHGVPLDAPKDMIDIYGDKHGFYEKVGDVRAMSIIYVAVDPNGERVKFFVTIELLMLSVFVGIHWTIRRFLRELSNKDKFIAKQSRFVALGEMISMIAHQWRQPLTGMGMSVNNLLLDLELGDIDEDRLKENLELINVQIAYLSGTIDDFKNFFKPNVELEEVNLLQLMKNSCMVIDSSLRSNSIALAFDIAPDMVVKTRKNDLTQVVLNLVKNSMDAYVDGNRTERLINISATKSDKRVELFVQDFAGGIPKEIIDKIFDPYFSTKENKNGTGLGLYMSKMIVEDHLGGYLDVAVSGESTTFKIALALKG